MSERFTFEKDLGFIVDKVNKTAIILEGVPISGDYTAMMSESIATKENIDGVESITPEIILLTEGMSYNNRYYSAESMTNSIKDDQGVPGGFKSLVIPDGVPVVINHWHSEQPVQGFEATAVGYVESAKFFDKDTKPDMKKAHIRVWPTIIDPHAIKLIKDGRIRHVSISAITNEVICSICGANVLEQRLNGDDDQEYESMCHHIPGLFYEVSKNKKKIKCFHKIGPWWAQEMSFVTFPGKRDAKIVNIGESNEMDKATVSILIEGLINNINENTGDNYISENINDEISYNIDENTDIIVNSNEDWNLEEIAELDKLLDEELGEKKLSTAARNKLKDSDFCGPNRSFPVKDCPHVTAARRLLGRAKASDATKSKISACVERKAKKLGCDKKKENFTIEYITRLHNKLHEDWSKIDNFDSDKSRRIIKEHLEAVEQLYQLTEKTHKVIDNLDKTLWECLKEGDENES